MMKPLKKIKIVINNNEFVAEIFDTPTGKAITENLPLKGKSIIWGKEIYFTVPVTCNLEHNSRSSLEIGEIGYFPPLKAFCIFFGPTPVSLDEKPRAADNVNVFGRITSQLGPLEAVVFGDQILVSET